MTGDERTAAVAGSVPRRRWVTANGLTLACLEWGADDAPPLVLVHGNGAHAHWWDPIVPALAPDWRLLAPDLRGHGESDRPETPAYRLDDYVRDLVAVLDALVTGPVALVGHSMGGRIAVALAAAAPARVRALVVIDSRLEAVRPELAAQWRGRIAGARDGRGYPTREAAMAAFRFVPDEADVATAIVDDLAWHAVVERGPADWTFRFDRAVLSLEGDGANDLLARAATVRCPALVIGGESSWVLDAAERARIVAAMPHATVRTFPGGHHVLVSRPEPVGAVVREFLASLLPAGVRER